eukprot:3828485-Amphidinium_carterae.1
MENAFGGSILQVENEPSILALVQGVAKELELAIPWRAAAAHEQQSQSERFHKTLFAQVRAIRFDLVDRYNLGQPDNVPEKLLPWILQHACFSINRYLVHSDGLTNYQRRWGVKYNAAICNFGEMVLADVKHIAVKKFAIRNQEQKVEGIWLGKTTHSGEHIIALKNNGGVVFHTRTLSRMTPDQHWSGELFNATEVGAYDGYYDEARLLGRSSYWSSHHRPVLLKDLEVSPDGVLCPGEDTARERVVVSGGSPEKEGQNEVPPKSVLCLGEVQPRPGLDVYVRPTSKAMAKPAAYRPTHQPIGKQTPPIVAQLEE